MDGMGIRSKSKLDGLATNLAACNLFQDPYPTDCKADPPEVFVLQAPDDSVLEWADAVLAAQRGYRPPKTIRSKTGRTKPARRKHRKSTRRNRR